jgi:Zn-finger nucleic acid-binding protein
MAEPTKSPARPWEVRTWTSERACPVCRVALFAAEKDAYRIDACGSCGGSWMSHAHARKMIDSADKAPVELARMTEAVVPRAGRQGDRLCPDCGKKLQEDTIEGIVVDVCGDHGTWFDPRELEQVAVALVREYGPAAREAARDAAQPKDTSSVSVERVAIGVASLTLGLLGAAIGTPPIETDIFGHEVRRK